MIKHFEYCVETVNNPASHNHFELAIETDGRVSDWFRKLYAQLNAVRIRSDYASGDYVTNISCWDADSKVYQYASGDHIRSKGLYFQYLRQKGASRGQWYAQYPENAYHCHGSFSTDIEGMCDRLDCNPTISKAPVGFSDILAATLFPDQKIDLDDHISASTMPEKKKVLETIDQTIKVLNWVEQQQLHQYIDIPDNFYLTLERLTYRLSDARVWVESSKANIRA